ncbi:MAG: AAA family ATPase [Methylacidiphilales bacterium]|nr:AAA family ATPase [Candidatus Methylacidiphilales bacterium]
MNLDELEKEVIEAEEPREPRIRVFTPSELRAYNPAQEPVLVGDNHVTRGEVFVIGGEPGVGKSRLAVSLAIAGANGSDWQGLKVRDKFRTLILQTENGRYRLKNDFDEIAPDGLDDWLRISEPPPYGLTFNHPEFQEDLAAIIRDFKPHVVLLDPWNAIAKDDRQKEYAEAFDSIRANLPKGDDKPALGIVAHTRKPHPGERRNGGISLMHTLAGSYMLSSVPRCVWIVVRGSEDEADESVVVFNPKNNDGQKSLRSAWVRKNGLFEPLADFDWKQFDKPPDERRTISKEDIEEVLKGQGVVSRSNAVKRLIELTGLKQSACFAALKADGKFAQFFTVANDGLTWR